MTGTDLIRLSDSILWELRRSWASGRRVSLTLTDEAGRRIEGHVSSVSATSASATINGRLIPADAILAVHNPSILADSTYRSGDWHATPKREIPQQEELPGVAA